jgi:hypothetical protein
MKQPLPPTLQLLHRASWSAEKRIKQTRVAFGMLWVTETMAGLGKPYATDCEAHGVEDQELLAALCHETRLDFAENDVERFAVCYLADLVDFNPGPLRDPPVRERKEIVAIEAHNREGTHAGAHREVVRVAGCVPLLRPLSPMVILTHSRYADLLPAIVDVSRYAPAERERECGSAGAFRRASAHEQ